MAHSQETAGETPVLLEGAGQTHFLVDPLQISVGIQALCQAFKTQTQHVEVVSRCVTMRQTRAQARGEHGTPTLYC